MKFTMTTPCNFCPFVRTGLRLLPERAEELGGQIVDRRGNAGRGIFACHKTATVDDDDEGGFVEKGDGTTQHCAGALIFAEKQDAPTQMMRFEERVGGYDYRKLNMKADVFDDLDEMIAVNAAAESPLAKARRKRRRKR